MAKHKPKKRKSDSKQDIATLALTTALISLLNSLITLILKLIDILSK